MEIDLGGATTGRVGGVFAGPGGVRLVGWYDAARGAGLTVTDTRGRTTTHRSRRHGRPDAPPDAVAATLTGSWLAVLTRCDGVWTVRGKVHLPARVDPRDPAFVAGLTVGAEGATSGWRAGTFGQLGLRDVHLVTHADGTAYERDGRLHVTVTHAGPGFADAAHCGVWSWLPGTTDLRPCARLWFRRDGRLLGDHAVHLVRHEDRWLVAASTWGDFERRSMGITISESSDDLLAGEHVLEPRELPLPTAGLGRRHVGVWDPDLALIDGHWHVAFVAARRFFDFRPALARATEPGSLDGFELLGVADDRRATEGTVLARLDGTWRVLASDGPDNPRGLRERFPVFDLTMREVGVLDAPYPTNIPWPTVVERPDGWHLLTFDGTAYGGAVPGYGTHGDLVVMRTEPAAATSDRAHDHEGPR